MANEPSVGLFHVQEHIRKTVPVMVKMQVSERLLCGIGSHQTSQILFTQRDMKTTTQRIDEVKYDTAYSLRTVQGLHGLTTFTNIKDMIVNCINVMKEIPRYKSRHFAMNVVNFGSLAHKHQLGLLLLYLHPAVQALHLNIQSLHPLLLTLLLLQPPPNRPPRTIQRPPLKMKRQPPRPHRQ